MDELSLHFHPQDTPEVARVKTAAQKGSQMGPSLSVLGLGFWLGLIGVDVGVGVGGGVGVGVGVGVFISNLAP